MESWRQEWQKILGSPENSAATSFGKFSTIRIRTFKACQNITHMQKINDNDLEWSAWFHHNNIPCLDTNLLTVELELLIPSRMSSQQSWKLKSLFLTILLPPCQTRKRGVCIFCPDLCTKAPVICVLRRNRWWQYTGDFVHPSLEHG